MTIANLGLGFLIGFVVLSFSNQSGGPRQYLVRWWRVVHLALYFIQELLLSSFRITYDILTPRHRMRPGIIAVPLDVSTDAEITMLAVLITLTPGTLCLDVSSDRKVMYIHAVYAKDKKSFICSIKEGLEKHVLRSLR